MTPSINRLAESAKALGQYYAEFEYDLVEQEFAQAGGMNFEQFARWVTGYQYYHTIVCICSGVESDIMKQLEEDYDTLTAVAGREAG